MNREPKLSHHSSSSLIDYMCYLKTFHVLFPELPMELKCTPLSQCFDIRKPFSNKSDVNSARTFPIALTCTLFASVIKLQRLSPLVCVSWSYRCVPSLQNSSSCCQLDRAMHWVLYPFLRFCSDVLMWVFVWLKLCIKLNISNCLHQVVMGVNWKSVKKNGGP